ncbi:hypothetical protein BurJ1DRAFT_4330 [Burkholderiales bacterium JOSHI_001]|nr:hypothetical protein BurJ1DRAFT_4330 [Burkholderiales bacterium JOSHI_001]
MRALPALLLPCEPSNNDFGKFPMKHFPPLAAIPLAALLFLTPLRALAGDGHDHGAAAPAATGPALPRFAASSDVFELVGVLNGKQITLYLDRATDNSPVTEAQIELEVAGKKFKAAKQGSDEFEVVLPEAPKPGALPITATVTAGADSDLLAGELDIHEAAHADEAEHSHSWKEYAGWALGGIAALVVMLTVGRRVMRSRQVRMGSAA